jgi:hypothetical protein
LNEEGSFRSLLMEHEQIECQCNSRIVIFMFINRKI